MRTWTTTHECSHEMGVDGAECGAQVTLEYEAGLSPDEFYLVDDDAYCDGEYAHQQTQRQLDRWFMHDMLAFREYLDESMTYFDEGGNG